MYYLVFLHPRCNMVRLQIRFQIFLSIIGLYNDERHLVVLKSKILLIQIDGILSMSRRYIFLRSTNTRLDGWKVTNLESTLTSFKISQEEVYAFSFVLFSNFMIL